VATLIKGTRVEERLRSGWYLLWDYAREHPFVYIGSVVGIGGSSVLATFIPRLIGQFTDALQKGRLDSEGVRYFAFVILGVGLVRVTLGWLGRVLSAQHGRIVTYKIRDALFAKWESLPLSYYHGHSVGDLLSHALSDVEVIRQVATMGINMTVNGAFMLGAALYMMTVHMNTSLALASLCPLIAIPLLVRHFGPRIRARSAKFQASLGAMSQSVEETFGGIRAIKAFGNEAVAIHTFQDRIDAIVREKMSFVRLSAIFGALIPFLGALGFIVVLAYGGHLAIQHVITLGDLVAFLLYLTLLKMPLEQLGNMLNLIQRASASLTRIAVLLEAVPDVRDREDARVEPPTKGGIEVRNLTFHYPGHVEPVLKNVSFTLPPGGTLGITGPIGSGKSTLIRLLTRLYEPPDASVFIDGVDVLDYRLESLRRSVAYVPQSGFLFSASLGDNISFAEESADLNKIERAARRAAVDGDIRNFPEGYGTEIGERGVRLSGGQKQRVAIARALYKDAPILVMDDSLSAVDTQTERRILEGFRAERGEGSLRTTLVISHRLSAVRDADEILVLKGGVVVERGRHDDLVRRGGLYATLWDLQSGGTGRSEPVSASETPSTGLLEVILNEDEENAKNESVDEGG